MCIVNIAAACSATATATATAATFGLILISLLSILLYVGFFVATIGTHL